MTGLLEPWNLKAARKSAVALLAMLLVLLVVSFLPFGSGDGSRGVNEKSALLLQQIAAVDNLPPAVDVKIEPAVKDDIKEALYLASAAKTKKEREAKGKVVLVVKATGDIGKEVERLKGKVGDRAASLDEVSEYVEVRVDAAKVAELAGEGEVVRVYPMVYYSLALDESVPMIKADAFWNSGYKGSGVKVAVLDTGIDANHPMLKGRVVAEKDFSGSGSANDNRGHGTHVAGTIAGTTVSDGKYFGVAPEVQLLNAKVFPDVGKAKTTDVVEGIKWAVENGAKVISMSFGAPEADNAIENEIKTAVGNGVIAVASSGNCGSGCPDMLACGSFRGVTAPGSSPNVIAVGAVDKSKKVACFSSGENVQNVGIKPDFTAPGVDIKSSVPDSGYEAKMGTSMAAPHVSGAVALLLGKSPQLKQDDVKRILEKTALDLGDIGKDVSYGFGLIDMAKALAYKEGLEVKVELEQQVISGSAQKITVRVYDDVTVNSVKAAVTKPNNAKADVTFGSTGSNVFTYDFTDTALMGNYVVDAAVNYGGTSGSSGTGSETGGEAGSGSADSSSITVTQTAYFKVTSLTGDFGNVEEISILQQQKLSSNITGTIKFANTAAVELNFSALLQLLDNGTLAQEIRLQPVTIAANSGATAAVNNALEIGPGNYTLRILTDYGAGSLVNETNITVTDDLAPQVLGIDYRKSIKVNDAQVIAVQLYEHQKVSAGLRLDKYDGQFINPIITNYTSKTISEFGNNKTIAITIYNGSDLTGGNALNEGSGYTVTLQLCDESGNCYGKLGSGKKDAEFSITACSGKSVLAVKTYDVASVFEEAAAAAGNVCLSALNKSVSGTPPASYLERFDAVVWTTGTDLVNVDGNDAAVLTDYYGKKGKVAVEGSDVAFRHGSDELMGSVLHAQLKTDLGFTVTSVANMSNLSVNITRQHPIVYGLTSPLPFNATIDPFPDAIAAANGGVELAKWSGLETKGSAIVAYESENGSKKSLLLPFSITALNGSDAKALSANSLKWLLEDSAVDVAPLGMKYGGEYPLITRKIGPYCPMVCREMWELKNGICGFTNCGSGCGADNITTFAREDECGLARQYYESGAGSGVIVEGEEFKALAIIGSSEKLASPLRAKVLVDGDVLSEGVAVPVFNAPPPADKTPPRFINVTYSNHVWPFWKPAFIAKIFEENDLSVVKISVFTTSCPKGKYCILAEGQLYDVPVESKWKLLSKDGANQKVAAWLTTPLEAGSYYAQLRACDASGNCGKSKLVPFKVWWFITGDNGEPSQIIFFKEPEPGDYAFSCEPEALEAEDYLNCLTVNKAATTAVINDLDSGEGSSSDGSGGGGGNGSNGRYQYNYSYNFSTSLGAGQHIVTVFANSDFSIKENNYANNIKDFSLMVYPKLPDLTLTGFAYNYNRELKNVKTALTASNFGGTATKATVEAELKPEGRIIFDDETLRCGGIAGLKCAEKLQCIYSDGSTGSTYPDELGWCVNETDSKWFAPKKQKIDVELAPGEAKYLTFTFELPQCMIEPWLCGWKLPSAYNFTAAIDPANEVSEHNESNNELVEKIYLCSKEKVLVVDDNDAAFFSTPEPSSSDEFLDVLRNSGYCVEAWDEKRQGTPGSGDLSGFKAVVWSAGDYFNGTVSNEDAMAIGNYSGGLLVEGSDVGLDNADGNLLQGILTASFSSDMLLNELQNETLLLRKHAITENVTGVSISKEKSPYPDAVEADAAVGEVVAEWQNGNGTAAITASNTSSRKTAYYAFSVDGITDAAAMEKLVINTVEWLLENPDNPPVIKSLSDGASGEISGAAIKITMNEGQTRNFSVLAEDPDGDPLTYNWLLNGTLVSGKYYFAFSPKYNESGTYNITVIVSDGQAEARAELLVTVLDTMECDPARQTRLCQQQLGVCSGSNVTCNAAGKWPGCTAATYLGYNSKYEVTETSCDGLDNDCDGLVDEGFGDVDDDELADCIDKDNDNDDVEDDEDDLIGNETSINFTGDAGDEKKFKISVEDSKDEKEKAQKVKWVRINNSDKPLLQFNFNFSKGNILLRNLTIEKQKNNSKEGFTLVRGLDLKGGTKQVYVDRLIAGSNAVCVKDKEVLQITEVSSSCDSEGESLLTCEAAGAEPASSGLACRLTSGNGQFQIYGLKHSAIMEACADADLDSYLPVGCSGGLDCNDGNSSISPAAAEVCNGVDDNCNGQVDENRACNTAPVLQSIGNKTVSENGTLSFAVAATDADGDMLAFNATSLPAGASFDNATAAFAWTPTFEQSGVYAVMFNVSDSLAFDYETINITVANINRAPVFETAGNKTVMENTTLSFTIGVTDPDGDSLAQLFVNVPERLTNAQFSSSTREFKWTPTFDDSGSYTTWFTASDGQLSANEFVNVTVVNANRAPRFENLTNSTALENSSLRFFVNASDPDKDSVAITLAELPAKFSSSATFDGREFAMPLGFEDSGNYSVIFSANDGQATIDATVNFTVTNVNRAPSISSVSGNLTVNETEKVTTAVNASDADGDALTYSLNDSRFSQPSPGSFEWQTGFSSSGTYVVLATASDGSATAQFAFTATVKNVNRAPRFENVTNQTVLENSTLSFFANATDPDGDSLQFTVEVPPAMAAAEFSSSKMEFSWAPTFEDSGNYKVKFIAGDGQYDIYAELNITVLNVNVAPSITNVHGSLFVNETENVTVIINASDHDGDALAYGLNDSRFVQDAAVKNKFNWKTGYEDAGNYVVLASASDGSLTTTAAATVKVDNANRAPVLAAMGNKTVNENSTLRFTVTASDPDSDAVSITVAKPQAAEGLAFDSSTSEVVWTPTFEQAGSYALAVTASDGNLSDSEEINITVLNVNRAPAIMLLLVDPPDLVMGEGEMKTFAADVADADNDAITVAWKVNGETVSTQPQLEFTPKYYESGEYAIELLVSDYASTTTTAMTLTVQDTLDCEVGQTKLCPLQFGVCANSLETCAAPGNWLGCAAAAYYSFNRSYVAEEASPASCDGLDNDCDGSVDERPTCTLRDNWIDVNGKWRIDDEGFSPVWSKPYSEHALIAEKNETFSDVEVKVEMSTDSSTPRVGVCARLSQDGKGYCLSPGWGSTRQITLSRFKGYPFEPVQMKAGPHVPVSNGGKLYLKLQAAGNILKGKVWPVGGPEPGWQVEATTDIMGEQLSSGFIGYYAYYANVTFGHYSASLPGEANGGPEEPCSDSDGDGQQDAHCGGTDCNDSNESVYWNAAEACNGADDDCDSQADEGCLLGSGWSVVNGDWAYYGEGRLMPVSYGYGGHPIVVRDGENFTDALITATGVNYGGRNELGLCGRLSPDGKGYCLSHGGGGIGYVILRYFDGYPYSPQAIELGPNIGVELGQPYSFKLLVNGSDLKGKVWLAAGQEPVEWQVQDRSSMLSSGSAGYYSYYTNATFEGLGVNIIS